jgi:hypothetical protein
MQQAESAVGRAVLSGAHNRGETWHFDGPSERLNHSRLAPEAEAYFAKKGCEVLLQRTPEAIGAFNRSHAKKIGLFHVTC